MKKSLIAVAGASLAAAAMPALGVFAAGSFTDTVQVTVDKSCTWQASWSGGQGDTAGRTFSEDHAVPGTRYEFGVTDAGTESLPTIKMECNVSSGTWTVSAIGSSTGSSITAMNPSGTGAAIATGTATSGETSSWAFKIGATGGTIATGYDEYKAIPASSTTVLSGSASTTDITFKPQYQVYIGTNQAPDTYTGKVTYTLSTSL